MINPKQNSNDILLRSGKHLKEARQKETKENETKDELIQEQSKNYEKEENMTTNKNEAKQPTNVQSQVPSPTYEPLIPTYEPHIPTYEPLILFPKSLQNLRRS